MRKPTHLDHTRRGRGLFLVCLAAAVLTLSCGYTTPPRPQQPSVSRLAEPLPKDRYPDDIGRFLAGLPGRAGSPFAQFESDDAWIKHRKVLDDAWAKMEKDRLPAMRKFEREELGGAPAGESKVFYPFSGPDALTVTVFFPRSPVYVMVGLEPAGTLPAPQALEKKNIDQYLVETRASLASELDRSFFITRQMDREFRGQITDGLCLPILELLVRSGHQIQGFRYVRLDDQGQIISAPPIITLPAELATRAWRSHSPPAPTRRFTSSSIFP